jgi:endonuclease/exonuclease/phosphatase (EEP) superfamily protein YafD
MDNGNKHLKGGFYLLNVIVLSMLLLPIISLAPPYWWLDNLIGLQLQWSLLAVTLMFINLLFFKKVVLIQVSLFLFLITYNYLPWYQPFAISKVDTHIIIKTEILSIAQLNLHYENPNIHKLIIQAQQKKFNILILQEVADHQRKAVNQLSAFYPYSVGTQINSPTTSGMVLFSRWPIIESTVHDLGFSGGQIIEVLVQSPELVIPLQLFSIHPPSPRDKTLWKKRNDVLDYVQQQIENSYFNNQIIIGDFNSTPWTGALQSLINNNQLHNSGESFGYIPSFSFFQHGVFSQWVSSVYIDHCLVSSAIQVIDKSYQSIIGSDHVLINTWLKINSR